jgi:hypothetical protein
LGWARKNPLRLLAWTVHRRRLPLSPLIAAEARQALATMLNPPRAPRTRHEQEQELAANRERVRQQDRAAMEAAEFVRAQIKPSENHTHLLPKSDALQQDLKVPIRLTRFASQNSSAQAQGVSERNGLLPDEKGVVILDRNKLGKKVLSDLKLDFVSWVLSICVEATVIIGFVATMLVNSTSDQVVAVCCLSLLLVIAGFSFLTLLQTLSDSRVISRFPVSDKKYIVMFDIAQTILILINLTLQPSGPGNLIFVVMLIVQDLIQHWTWAISGNRENPIFLKLLEAIDDIEARPKIVAFHYKKRDKHNTLYYISTSLGLLFLLIMGLPGLLYGASVLLICFFFLCLSSPFVEVEELSELLYMRDFLNLCLLIPALVLYSSNYGC